MPTEQELRLVARLQGFDSAAKEVEKVGDAQAKVTEKTKEAKAPTDALGESSKKLNASQSDYVELLNRIVPGLGMYLDGLLKGGKIAGDFASANVNLTDVLKKVQTAVLGNVQALKGLAMLGTIAVAVYALVKAWQTWRAEVERTTKALEAATNAATQFKQEQAASQQALEDISDIRQEGPASAEESRRMQAVAGVIQERSPFLKPGAVQQAVALGGERPAKELEETAFLLQSGKLQLDPSMRPETRGRIIERGRERFAPNIQRAFARERSQEGELRQEAGKQLTSEGGSIDALLKLAERRTRGTGVDAERIAKLTQALGAGGEGPGGMPVIEVGGKVGEVVGVQAQEVSYAKQVLGDVRRPSGGGDGRAGFVLPQAGRDDAGAARLETAADKLSAAADALMQASKSQGNGAGRPTIVNQNNGRYIGPDAASRKRRVVNGESRARLAEML